MQTQKNIFYNVLLALSQVLFPLITFPYIARVLGPENIGLYNFSESYARYFALVAALGISVYGVREIAKKQANPKGLAFTFVELFFINLIATCFLSVVYIGTILEVDKLAAYPELFYWSFLFFFLQVFVLEWFFTGINQFKFIAVRFFFIRLLFVVALFVFIKKSGDYVLYMKMQVMLNFFLGLINFIYLRKFVDFKLLQFSQLNLKQHLKPLFILFLTIFSISIYLHFDTVLLGMLADNESVGYYSASLKLVKIIIAVLAAITAAMFPTMVKLFEQGAMDEFKKMLQEAYELVISIGIPTAILVCLLAPEIVYLLFGSNFNLAVLPLRITTPLIIIVSLSTIYGFQILSVHAKDKQILLAAIAGMVFSLALSFLIIPIYKQNGAAVTILLTEALVLSVFIYFSRKIIKINNSIQFLLKELIYALPYCVITFVIKEQSYTPIITVTAILIFSCIWFLALHFKILKTTVLQSFVSGIILKRIKK